MILKSPEKTTTTANRLIQKRKSIERKLEIMRKQKAEAELKEVRNKPMILTRSRKLAEKAELKGLCNVKTKEILKDSKVMCEDEMIELEQDIQMLEDCLYSNQEKLRVENFENGNLELQENVSIEKSSLNNIVARVKQMGRKSESPAVKTGKFISKEIKKIVISPARVQNGSPQRKFIKEKSTKVAKYKSASMENLNSVQFCYRSLSPFKIKLKRTIENS